MERIARLQIGHMGLQRKANRIVQIRLNDGDPINIYTGQLIRTPSSSLGHFRSANWTGTTTVAMEKTDLRTVCEETGFREDGVAHA